MFVEILLAILVGCLFGIFTGLTPGIHINLVSVMLISFSGFFLSFFEPISLAVFIVSMGVTHTFLDFIPSIFLGAPQDDTALNVLPGHKLLLRGMGYEAVKLTVIGSLLCLITTIIFIPIIIPFLEKIYGFLQSYIGYILIAIVIFMILKEKNLSGIFWSFFIFLASGILGIITLNWPNLRNPLFPLLSGLFGISTLLISLSQKVELPKQRITEMIRPNKKSTVKAVTGATLFGTIAGLFPGLGSAQAAIIAMQFVGNIGMYSFMIMIGGINTVNFVFSLATFYALEKARNGAVVAIIDLVKSIDLNGFIILLASALIAGSLSTFLALNISKVFSKMFNYINYKMLVISVITLITLLVLFFSGFVGLIILITSTTIGLIAPMVKVKRSIAMGSLILPVILYFIL